MFEVILLSSSILLLTIILGAPVTILAFCEKIAAKPIELPVFLAISITSGFGISAFSASLAYSFFGINLYLLIVFLIGLSLWILVFIFRSKLWFKIVYLKGFITFALASFFVALYFAKTQWDANQKPRIFSGIGPDVSQNLLAAHIAPTLGSTWFDASNRLIESLNVSDLNEAAIKMFEMPSFVHIAGYDYLVFGIRWGLTVPFSQIIRIFGPQTIMLEIGSVLVVTLLATLIIGFSVFRIANKSFLFSALGAMTIALNGSFLNQYFNGGLSQAFGLVGNFGVLMCLILLLSNAEMVKTRKNKVGMFIVATLAWTSSAISYVDATLVIGIFMVVLTVIMFKSYKTEAKRILIFMIIPGIMTLALNPIFTYSIWENLNFRINANLGTGINTGTWRLPTQNFGLFSVYSQFSENNSIFIQYSSLLILLLAVLFVLVVIGTKPRVKSFFAPGLLASTILVGLGYILARNSRNSSDYVYNKISTFLAPFILVLFLLFISVKANTRTRKIENLFVWFFPLIITVSAFSVENSYSKGTDFATIMPTEYSALLKNEEIKRYFQESNYILPYKPAYNFLGIFGVHYWISKAPNDMNYAIESRLDKPLKLFCFVGENICKPKGQKIVNAQTAYLEKFGIEEYESNLTTREYLALSIDERYNYAFDEMGTPRGNIPEKYMGGNPYLK
jgi:hypothetical protein